MGLLFRSLGTRNIIDTLNTAFAPKGLAGIQAFAGKAPNLSPFGNVIAGRNWEPYVVANDWLSLNPKDEFGSINPGHSKRWKFFLQNVIGDKTTVYADGKTAYASVFVPLRNALADVILNTDSQGNYVFVRATFDHVELEDPNDPDATKLNPNLGPSIVIFDSPVPNPAGGTLGTGRHITLFTQRVKKGV